MIKKSVVLLFLISAAMLLGQRADTNAVQGLAHINIMTRDMQRSIDFYAAFFGFETVYRTVIAERGLRLTLLKKGSCVLELVQPADTASVKIGVEGSIPHFALEVAELDPLVARLKAAGVRCTREPFVRETLMHGFKAAFFQGPSGEAIELMQYLARSPLAQASGRPSVALNHGDLMVSANKRGLQHKDGTPFFYLGDTAWELFHRADREEAAHYLENRRQKGFTVIQAVALSELDGLRTANAYGDLPLQNMDPGRPEVTPGNNPDIAEEYDYWDHVDFIIDTAAAKGIYIGLLPTWGDKVLQVSWGVGPVVFTEENARAYGRWLAERYKNRPNIIWILGGDRPVEYEGKSVLSIWRAMAEGVRSLDKRHLITFHPWGGSSSSRWLQQESWLDFNMLQSGHGQRDLANGLLVRSDYAQRPVKPCLDGEARYEDHPINWKPENGWFDDYDVRQAAYWNLFSGGFGHTYGNHNVWQLYEPGRQPVSSARYYWYESLDPAGAFQMQYVRHLIESRPMLERVPDQSLIREAADSTAVACRGTSFAMIYLANGGRCVVSVDPLAGQRFRAQWFDPRHGTYAAAGTFARHDMPAFTAPGAAGRGNDWVLILEAVK